MKSTNCTITDWYNKSILIKRLSCFWKTTSDKWPVWEGTSLVVISGCLWQECHKASAKLADCMVPYDRTHVAGKGSRSLQTPNIICALYLSSLATRNNAGHVLLLLLLAPCPVIYKWTQLIKALLYWMPSDSCFTSV